MVRPFTFRDTLLIRQLADRGASFDSRIYLTRKINPLRYATLAGLLPLVYPETQIVDRPKDGRGFAQLTHRRGSAAARVRFLAPMQDGTPDFAPGLIEALLVEAGRRGAQNVQAEVEENSGAYDFFRREGFTIYARQEIWKGVPPFSGATHRPEGQLQPLTDRDVPAALGLYCSIVPALVYQMEGFPKKPSGWVLYQEGELVGYFGMSSGPLGIRVEPVFHPGARHVATWIAAWLPEISLPVDRPVYLSVRSYQDWIGPILGEIGFSPLTRQAVFSRRTVAPVVAQEAILLAAGENPAPQATTYSGAPAHKAYDTPTPDHR